MVDIENLQLDSGNKSSPDNNNKMSRVSVAKSPAIGSAEIIMDPQPSPVKRNTLVTPDPRTISRQLSASPTEQYNRISRLQEKTSRPSSRSNSDKSSTSRPPSTASPSQHLEKPALEKNAPQVGQKQAVAAGKVLRCAHHGQAGQELCYLCHQREARNVQISYAKEKAQLDKEYDTILQKYQHQQDADNIAKELVNCIVKLIKFHSLHKIAVHCNLK